MAACAVIPLGVSTAPRRELSVPGADCGAARKWRAGGNLSGPGSHGALYLPQAVIAAMISPVGADLLWRMPRITMTAYGVRLARWVAVRRVTRSRKVPRCRKMPTSRIRHPYQRQMATGWVRRSLRVMRPNMGWLAGGW